MELNLTYHCWDVWLDSRIIYIIYELNGILNLREVKMTNEEK